MSIRELVNDIHALIPNDLQVDNIPKQYTWMILSAVDVVDTLTLNRFEFSYKLTEDRGGKLMKLSISGRDSKPLDAMVERIMANNALFAIRSTVVNNTENAKGWIQEIDFGSFGHLSDGVTRPRDSHQPYQDFEVSWPLWEALCCLFNVHHIIKNGECDHDTVRWFADRLPDGEVRGEHLLMLQNFLYRRINKTRSFI